MARAETSMIDRQAGDTGATVTRMMRNIGGGNNSERQDTTVGVMHDFITTYDLAAPAALMNLICIC
jgi:hypothetical protein